jgi:flavin reductase (DIM6/NTAB) family NADH-FMN oxidoreductase RutF
VGSSRSFAAAASYFDGSVYLVTTQATWTSSDPAIATVSSAGVVTGLAVGSTTITATYKGVSGTKVITVNLVAEF